MARPDPAHDLAAARRLAARLGLGDVEPVVLKLAKHTTLRLGDLPLVARIQSSGPLDLAFETMDRELRVARHLARAGAPVIRPSDDPPPGPYREDGCVISLWAYANGRSVRDRTEALAAAAGLRRIHRALAGYEGHLPSFAEPIAGCRALLEDPSALHALAPPDRAFLEGRYRRAIARLPWDRLKLVPLHGDTHQGNVLVTDEGPIWCDFEAVCRGPLEWDLRSLKAAARSEFEGADPALLADLRQLGQVCVALWCWADAERSAEIRAAAQYHLACLKRRDRLRPNDASP